MPIIQRKKIGLLFINDPGWTGGSDYVINLINALQYLPDDQQPALTVFVHNTAEEAIVRKRVHYPYLDFHHFPKSKKKTLLYRVLRKLKLLSPPAFNGKLRFIYPMPQAPSFRTYFRKLPVNRCIYWIPDFQEKYYPNLFEPETLSKREARRTFLTNSADHTIVLSSEAAKKDLLRFYPNNKAQLKVLNFAVPSKLNATKDIASVKKKFGLPEAYFLCPNQFWAHKNHMAVFKAVAQLKANGHPVTVAFCGKEHDPRNPQHVPQLKAYVQEHQLEQEIRFLGFIDKADQVALIKGALAILQPSLFEGWSTTIEDAISMGKQVIASNLPVNVEQLGEHGIFFDPHDPKQLAHWLQKINVPVEIDYRQEERILAFAERFVRLDD